MATLSVPHAAAVGQDYVLLIPVSIVKFDGRHNYVRSTYRQPKTLTREQFAHYYPCPALVEGRQAVVYGYGLSGWFLVESMGGSHVS